MKHIDEFIDDPRSDAYASFVFSMHRWPAVTKAKCRAQIAKQLPHTQQMTGGPASTIWAEFLGGKHVSNETKRLNRRT